MLVHWIWFSLLQGMNGRQKLQLLERFHSPEDMYALEARGLKDMPFDCTALLQKDLRKATDILKTCAEQMIGVLTFTDSGYPNRLRSVDDPPMVLYYRGSLPTWELQPVIGVVGTRKASSYGLRIAGAISAQIAACGGIVASGGAFGIDTKALDGALSQGQTTVAVMAGGLDHPYPKANMPLFHKIMENGCLLSEHPPYTKGYRGNFLQRNRIISALSDAVLVVEAPHRSGALSTARHAMEQGKELFAVPGNVDNPFSVGSNELLQDGARPALSGWDVLADLQSSYPGVVEKRSPQLVEKAPPPLDKKEIDTAIKPSYTDPQVCSLSAEEQQIVAYMSPQPKLVDEILAQVDIPASKALSLITMLAMRGVIQNHPGGQVSLKTKNS